MNFSDNLAIPSQKSNKNRRSGKVVLFVRMEGRLVPISIKMVGGGEEGGFIMWFPGI